MSMARSTPAQKPRGLARMIFITLRLLAISYQPSALQKQRHHTSHEPSTSTELGIPKGFRLSTKNQLNPSPHSILPPPLIIPLIFNCASDGREDFRKGCGMGSERTSPERRGPARRTKEESWYRPPRPGGQPVLSWSNGLRRTATG